MYFVSAFLLHCFVLCYIALCFPDPYVFRLTLCFSADTGFAAWTGGRAPVRRRCYFWIGRRLDSESLLLPLMYCSKPAVSSRPEASYHHCGQLAFLAEKARLSSTLP